MPGRRLSRQTWQHHHQPIPDSVSTQQHPSNSLSARAFDTDTVTVTSSSTLRPTLPSVPSSATAPSSSTPATPPVSPAPTSLSPVATPPVAVARRRLQPPSHPTSPAVLSPNLCLSVLSLLVSLLSSCRSVDSAWTDGGGIFIDGKVKNSLVFFFFVIMDMDMDT